MMQNQKPISLSFSITTFFFYLFSNLGIVIPKSTIEPCSYSNTCNALLGYTLYTDLKVSELSSLFQIDPISLLTTNAIDISYPDVENHILPSNLFLKIPILCSCVDGIRKSVAIHYNFRPSDTLSTIANSVYGGLVSADQIKEANSISDASAVEVGQSLVIPLPCTCFNGTDNFLPAIYMSYVVQSVDSLGGIASRYWTTISDLMNVNALGSSAISPGDILAIPLSACPSNFPRYASDFGLSVANGSYAITSSHCVQCSCGPGNRNLYCMPASLAVSCWSMQCRNSNLMIGNVTWQQTSAGCSVTSCSYGGNVNGTIMTRLSTSLQPRCPGPQQFPPLIAPPSSESRELPFSPAPAPSQSGGAATTPKSSIVPSSSSGQGLPPTSAPNGGFSSGSSLVNPLSSFPIAIGVGLFFDFMPSFY